jgi:uncharacterized protein (DUF2384 family)
MMSLEMTAKKLNENDILARLYVLYPSERARRWVLTPHPLLDYKSPHEAIEIGRIGEVDRIVALMEDGAFI